MKFNVINLGCRVNRVESDGFAASLTAHAWEPSGVSEADVIIINTCTVTGEAEKKTRKAVRKALKDNTSAAVVVTGCAASIDPDTYRALDKRVRLVADKGIVVEEVLRQCGHCSQSKVEVGTELRFGDDYMSRPGVKIQDGCDNACSYCIVHKARGKARSRAYDEVLKEVQALGQAGAKELVLTGIDLGSYRDGHRDLCDLLKGILENTEDLRIRLSSIEPHTVNLSLADLMVEAEGRLCRYLHIPLQSGSDRILSEMKRLYTSEQFESMVCSLYEKVPELSISTDMIVGFPSESRSDFEESKAVARRCRFSKIHVFPYSPRKNTPAAQRQDQIEPSLKKARAKELMQLSDVLREEDRRRREGTAEWVLVESRGYGMSESYHRIELPHDTRAGELLKLFL